CELWPPYKSRLAFHNWFRRLFTFDGRGLNRDHVRRAFEKFNAKRRAVSRLTRHGNSSAMIADNRLHNRETEACAVQLRGVIRREKALAFFASEPCTRVGDLQAHAAVMRHRPQREFAATGHRVDGVEDKVANGAMKQNAVGLNERKFFIELQLGGDFWLAGCDEARFKKAGDATDHFVYVQRVQFGARHFREITEATDNRFQVVNFGEKRFRGFAKDLIEIRGVLRACTLKILNRDLQRE